MADPIVTPLSVDPEELFQRFVEQMQAQIPGWEPSDGSLDVWIAEGFAQLAAELAETATEVVASIFRWYGANIAAVPPVDASPATSTITITAADTAGHTITAGYHLALTDANGELVGFSTTQDAVIAAGATTAAGIPIVADVAGLNELSGTVTQVDSLAYVATVTLDAPTAGGSDAEEDPDYLARLVAEERLRSVAPILARDFAQLSKRVLEVHRTAYLDQYNPADGTSDNALVVTLVPVRIDGSNVSSAGKSAVAAQFAENGSTPALVNFVVNVADPHRTAVDVAFTAVAAHGFTPAQVKTAGEDAIRSFLDPANWGLPEFGQETRFDIETKVRIGRLQAVLYAVEGVLSVTAVTLGLSGGTLAATDYTLPVTNAEPVGMPVPTTITGTVT